MKSRKIIGILFSFLIISISFCVGYKYNSHKEIKSVNGIKWSLESSDQMLSINLSDEKVFPGSNGKFYIEIDANKSELGLFYKIVNIEEKNIPLNMKFKAEIKDEYENTILMTKEYNSFKQLAEENLFGKIVTKESKKRIITIFWNWEFESDNTENLDNEFLANIEESQECYLKIDIYGEQLDINNL